jgi:beta-galactosidase
MLTFKGGTTGFWVETTGDVGEITVRISTRRMGEQRLTLSAA